MICSVIYCLNYWKKRKYNQLTSKEWNKDEKWKIKQKTNYSLTGSKKEIPPPSVSNNSCTPLAKEKSPTGQNGPAIHICFAAVMDLLHKTAKHTHSLTLRPPLWSELWVCKQNETKKKTETGSKAKKAINLPPSQLLSRDRTPNRIRDSDLRGSAAPLPSLPPRKPIVTHPKKKGKVFDPSNRKCPPKAYTQRGVSTTRGPPRVPSGPRPLAPHRGGISKSKQAARGSFVFRKSYAQARTEAGEREWKEKVWHTQRGARVLLSRKHSLTHTLNTQFKRRKVAFGWYLLLYYRRTTFPRVPWRWSVMSGIGFRFWRWRWGKRFITEKNERWNEKKKHYDDLGGD